MASRVRNLVTLRKNNKNNILWLLYNKGPMSRLTLATTCGLTGAAMTVLIKEMLAEETVIETERIQRNQTGRREVLLDINYNKFFAIGINIEEDYTYLSIGKLNQLQDIESFLTDDLKPDILESLITKLEGLLEKYQTKTIIGIGVGVVGLVDENSGIVLNSYGLFPENYQLKALLARRFSYPIYLSNNVRSQAKALINDESTDFLFIKHGPGVGASLVINGEVVEGFYNRAGELGHTVVDINGELCKCGKRGCLEVFLREKNIRQKYAKLSGKTVNIKDIYQAYPNEELIKMIIDECLEKMAIAIDHASALTDPLYIFTSGGIFSYPAIYEELLNKINQIDSKLSKRFRNINQEKQLKAMGSVNLVFKIRMFTGE